MRSQFARKTTAKTGVRDTARRWFQGTSNRLSPGVENDAGRIAQSSSAFRRPRRSAGEIGGYVLGIAVFPVSAYLLLRWWDAVVNNEAKSSVHDSDGAVAPAFDKFAVTPVAKPSLGGPFRLQSSRTEGWLTDRDVFLGKWTLLYFGFSKCAEICPNTMRFVADVMKASDHAFLGAEDSRPSSSSTAGTADAATTSTATESKRLQAAFVSIDFIRDTPQVVEDFVRQFGIAENRIVGLCGDKTSVETAARQWRVYFSTYDETDEERIAREARGLDKPQLDDTFQFDHSSAIYLVGPDGKMKDFFFREIGVQPTVERLGLHFANVYGIN